MTPSIMLTGVGKRYDIVSCFAALTTVVAVDPNPLAPARYAAQVRTGPPPIADPGYVPELARLCTEHGVGAVLPLTDLGQSRANARILRDWLDRDGSYILLYSLSQQTA